MQVKGQLQNSVKTIFTCLEMITAKYHVDRLYIKVDIYAMVQAI